MVRFKFKLAYNGGGFCGWQLQAQEKSRTVQGVFEEALARLAGQPIRAHGAGRTDAGVHALGQVAHCDLPEAKLDIPWLRALNALLPPDLAVLAAQAAEPGFHARFSATAKLYSYTLWSAPDFVLPQRAPYVSRQHGLDFSLMDQCANIFLGLHDFAAFQNKGTPVKDTQREILSISREPGQSPYEQIYFLRGKGFLKQMARNIMGTLIAAGRGKVSPEHIRSILANRDRSAAAPTAEAKGLCLVRVEYGEGDDGFRAEQPDNRERGG